MVRQHVNSLSYTALLSTIVPTKEGYNTYLSLKDKIQWNKRGYKETSEGGVWQESWVAFPPSSRTPEIITMETPVEKWNWNLFLPNIDSRPLHIVSMT